MEPKTISISLETILKTIGIIVAIGVAWFIRDILLLLFSSVMLAGVMYPFASWAEAKKIPKGLAIALLYLALFVLFALAIGFLIPAILDQTRLASGTFGGTLDWVRDSASYIRDATDRFGFTGGGATTLDSMVSRVQEVALSFLTSLNDLFGALAAIVIVLVLAFYLVIEDAAVKRAFRGLIPGPHQEFASHVAWQVIEKLGDWARGQIALSAIIGVAYFVGYSLIGVPYALLLALIAGLLEFVPYLGPVAAVGAAVFLALTVSPWKALAVLIFVIVIQQLQNHVLVPQVMRKAVGINPIISISAFLIGAKLFGVVGAIFAIPVATAASVALSELNKYRPTHHV